MKDWTLSDDARLLALFSKGWTRKEIAVDFGVTRNAICGRVHRLVYKPPAVDLAMPEVEISFEDVLEAEPMFEPPLTSMHEPYLWRIGQPVAVENVRAFVNGEGRFDDWSGTGTIDMIQYGGQYIRVVEEPYYAWVNWNSFDRMTGLGPC
jgi:hypothetical protein